MKSLMIRIGCIAIVAGAALWGGSGIASAGGGCHSGDTSGRGDTVDVADLCFTSTVLYVERGTEVTWTNDDPMTHNVVGAGGTWGDPGAALLPGDTVSYRFADDGVYPYACWFHPGMVGAIVVGDGVGSDVAGVVLAGSGNGGNDTSSAEVAAPVVADDGAGGAMWIAGGVLILGLAALGGAFAIATRNRRRSAVAG